MQRDEPAGRPELTILCPCYNEEAVIGLFHAELRPVLDSIADRYRLKVVFLNNGSTDGTLREILALRRNWLDVHVITYSRNVGYQRSLEGGLRLTHSDLFMFIDVDCEDPPRLIPAFLEKFEQGYDIVYGERVDREENAPLKAVRRLFYRLLRKMADEEIILDMAEFALFTAEVRDAVVEETNSFPFIRASIGRVGFRRIGIPFKRERRIGGQTHYNVIGMTTFAIAGILSASTLALRLPVYLLPLWLVALTILTFEAAAHGNPWTAATAFILFAAYVGSTLAFTSLYVARGYKNSLGRPNSFVLHRDTHLTADAAAVTDARERNRSLVR